MILAEQRKQESDRLQQENEKLQEQICTLTGKLQSVTAELDTYKKENHDMSCIFAAHFAVPFVEIMQENPSVKIKQEKA